MRKLIGLELKKIKLSSYLTGVAIANVVIMLMLVMMYFALISEGEIAFASYEVTFTMIGGIVRPTFMIFAAVLIAKLIIEEYKTNTISLMFLYPINRKKLIAAKLVIVAVFTFTTIFLSSLLMGTVFYAINSFVHIVPEALTAEVLKAGLLSMTLETIAATGIALIPLYFGMRKKSVPATIVSAIVLVSLLSSSANEVNLFSFIAIPITLAIVGCLIAYLAIRNIEEVDV